MNKKELIAKLAEKMDCTKKAAEDASLPALAQMIFVIAITHNCTRRCWETELQGS